MKNKDLAGGISFAVFGLIVALIASGIKMPANLSEPGPRLFPYISGIGMLVCGIGMALTAKANEQVENFLSREGWKRLAVVAAALILYYIGLEWIGFIIMTPVFAFSVILILSSGKKINKAVAAVIAVITTAALYLLFQKVFMIFLPTGKFF